MGKNLKGKELGKGIRQHKNGKYEARFLSKSGNRIGEYFDTPKQAKEWLDKKRYEDKYGVAVSNPTVSKMTVDDWFEYWIENIVFDLAPNTWCISESAYAASRSFLNKNHNGQIRSQHH